MCCRNWCIIIGVTTLISNVTIKFDFCECLYFTPKPWLDNYEYIPNVFWVGHDYVCIVAVNTCDDDVEPPIYGTVSFSNGNKVGSVAEFGCEHPRVLTGQYFTKCDGQHTSSGWQEIQNQPTCIGILVYTGCMCDGHLDLNRLILVWLHLTYNNILCRLITEHLPNFLTLPLQLRHFALIVGH